MRKLAVFVEGYTEILFAERLISEIAGSKNISIEQRKIRGGSRVRRTFSVIQAAEQSGNEKYYVLLVDCGGDALVKTRILEEHQNFSNNGYQKIIGIRDVRPDFTYEDIPQLEINLKKYIKTSLIPVEFILSVMEIEAWFLADFKHYPKIHPLISREAVKINLGFDPQSEDMTLRLTPASDLHSVYSLGNEKYETGEDVVRTINALDFSTIYLELKEKIPNLNQLCTSIDEFLS